MPEIMTIPMTGFELVGYEPQHAIEIINGGAKEPQLDLDEETLKFVNNIADKGPAMTGLFDGQPVSCGGITIMWPGVGEVWAVNVLDIGDYHIDPQIAKKQIWDWIAEYKIARLQTPLKSDYTEGEIYAKWLGFKFEGRLICYHKDGSDALMYSIINRQYLT